MPGVSQVERKPLIVKQTKQQKGDADTGMGGGN